MEISAENIDIEKLVSEFQLVDHRYNTGSSLQKASKDTYGYNILSSALIVPRYADFVNVSSFYFDPEPLSYEVKYVLDTNRKQYDVPLNTKWFPLGQFGRLVIHPKYENDEIPENAKVHMD